MFASARPFTCEVRCSMVHQENRSAGTADPRTPDQHSEVTAVRACSNLSNSRRKSSPLMRNSKYLAVPKSKSVIKQRDLAELAHLRRELGKLANRFDKKRSQVEGMLRRGADLEHGKHWVWLKTIEGTRLMLDE
jgi:hypothetical protein